VFFAVVGVLFVTLAGVIVSAFTDEPMVASVASRGLRIIASGFLFYAYGIVVTQSFNGAGDTWTPTVINLFGFWILGVPLAQLLARPLGLGPAGVFWSITTAFSTTAVAAALVFRRGRWKLNRV
jgi:Na+-driven multidrug efflux pump